MSARRRGPRISSVREAMAVVRDASAAELAAGRPADRDDPAPIQDAVSILRDWFEQLPPDRVEPAMTFPEFLRLLHESLRTSRDAMGS